MGRRMARRLLDAGHELTVWNRTPERVEDLRAAGAAAASSPAAAAEGAELVITMVADPAALRAVTEGPDGLAAGVDDSTIVVEMSTVGPAAVRRLASVLAPAGRILDAPVLGSLVEAQTGSLVIFVGGDEGAVVRAEPLLAALGKPMHVGPPGSGAAAKLVANSALFAALTGVGEALALAEGLGLDLDAAFRVLAVSPLAAQAERRRPTVETGDYSPRFELRLALKDAELMREAAAEAGVELRQIPAAHSWLADADAAGLGDLDYAAVLREIRGRR